MISEQEIEALAIEKYPSPNHPTGYAFKTSQVVEMERKAFKAGFQQAQSLNGWVSVEEALPEPSDYKRQTVLAVKSEQGYYSHKAMAWYGDNVGDGNVCFNVFDDRTSINKFKHTQVTHWMLIPE